MKKAFKITTYCLVLSSIVALGLCYLIIPERTKCAIDIVIEYINRPLGIVFGTTITLGLVITIIVKLVLDSHRNGVKQDINELKSYIEKQKRELENKKQEIETQKSEIMAYIGTYKEETNELYELVVKIGETSPNAKIKVLAQQAKEIKNKLDNELEQKVEIAEKYSDDKIGSLLKEFEELKRKVESYEREETIND